MKILMINTVRLEVNGITTCIMNYFDLLVSASIKVDILAPNVISEELRKQVEEKKRTIYELPLRKENVCKYFIELVKILKREKYDVVHIHGNSCTMTIELLAAKIAGCKVRIAHSHNTTSQHMTVHKLLRPIFEMLCNGRFACGEDAGKWLFREKEFFVVRNGIDISQYKYNEMTRKKIREYLGVKENEILLGHVGKFNFQKNHEFIIELMEKLGVDSGYKLVLIGDGDLKLSIKNQVEELNLKNSVIMTGNINNVPEYLLAMDVFILPSRFEGLPYVLIEAQAAGLPCLVADTVAREADLTGDIKYLSIEEPNLWVKQIESVSNPLNQSIRKAKIEKYQQDVKKAGYDISCNAERMIELYEKYLNENN